MADASITQFDLKAVPVIDELETYGVDTQAWDMVLNLDPDRSVIDAVMESANNAKYNDEFYYGGFNPYGYRVMNQGWGNSPVFVEVYYTSNRSNSVKVLTAAVHKYELFVNPNIVTKAELPQGIELVEA